MTSSTLTLGGSTYPVVLPNVRDPRLHVAAVIITIHVLGQFGLGFHVTIPQILAAILASAVLEVAITFHRRRAFVWPASAMLTGSGVALILRVPGTPDDAWSTYRWYVFAGVAAFSLLTKYVVQYRGAHIFNPSNIGLVVAFVALGSSRVEPLDFWWAPLNRWMLTGYAVILIGGLLITTRLRLLAAAATFWVTLAAGIAVLAASGHSMTARWAFAPVSGFDFWRVIVTSPEVLIFVFFMLTDPKTVPAGRVARIVFAFLVAVGSTLLMAPQSNEFGTKVALLGGLVVMCGLRPVLERVLPGVRSEADSLRRYATPVRTGIVAGAVVVLGLGVVAAGTPARGVVVPDAEEVLGRVPHDVDPSTLPTISVDQGVLDWNHEISGAGVQGIVLTLVENLELENQAVVRADPTILPAVDHGDRLDEMEARVADAAAGRPTVIERYQIDDVEVVLIVPFGQQTSLSLGLDARGTLTEERYEDGEVTAHSTAPFATTFVMRQVTGGRWLNVGVLPPGAGD